MEADERKEARLGLMQLNNMVKVKNLIAPDGHVAVNALYERLSTAAAGRPVQEGADTSSGYTEISPTDLLRGL